MKNVGKFSSSMMLVRWGSGQLQLLMITSLVADSVAIVEHREGKVDGLVLLK